MVIRRRWTVFEALTFPNLDKASWTSSSVVSWLIPPTKIFLDTTGLFVSTWPTPLSWAYPEEALFALPVTDPPPLPLVDGLATTRGVAGFGSIFFPSNTWPCGFWRTLSTLWDSRNVMKPKPLLLWEYIQEEEKDEIVSTLTRTLFDHALDYGPELWKISELW